MALAAARDDASNEEALLLQYSRYGAVSIELLPAAFSAARVQKEDIHIRNTPGGTGSVEHMLHTVPVPDFTVEKDKKAENRGLGFLPVPTNIGVRPQ